MIKFSVLSKKLNSNDDLSSNASTMKSRTSSQIHFRTFYVGNLLSKSERKCLNFKAILGATLLCTGGCLLSREKAV